MKMNAYTIYDVAAGTYMRPFFTTADGEATRSFKDIASDAKHPIGQHPEDYTLYRIGSWNDNTGALAGEELEKLMTGLEAVHATRMVNKEQLAMFDQSEEVQQHTGNQHDQN